MLCYRLNLSIYKLVSLLPPFYLMFVFTVMVYPWSDTRSSPTYIDPKDEKVIICGTGKNIAFALPNMMSKIEHLGHCFKDYRVIIYENNSTDSTKTILTQWAKTNNKIIIISETLTPQQLYARTKIHTLKNQAPNRMELIAYGRNEILKRVFNKNFNDFNFVIMTDLDFTKGWEVTDVLSSFNLAIPWDCIAANGITLDNFYYDRYAFRDTHFPLGPELINEKFWHDVDHQHIKFAYNSEPKQVYSAFGGIAIYQKQSLENCRYSGTVTEDLKKLMFDIINNKTEKTNAHYIAYQKILLNSYKYQFLFPFSPKSISKKSLIHSKCQTILHMPSKKTTRNGYPTKNNFDDSLPQLPVIFQPYWNYDAPAVCEHVPLHASMILNGHDKIYINPALICRYDFFLV